MDNQKADGYVKSNNNNGILTIEFFHPKSNSMPSSLLYLLTQHIHRADRPEVKCIVLKSFGEKAFCAGASFDELLSLENEQEAFRFFMGFANVINAMRKSSKLIVARVQGKSVGGGVGLAAAADYAIACEQSEVKLSELSIGIGPFVIEPVVTRKVGVSAFSQLCIDATMWRPAHWAKNKGLFAEVHPSISGMDDSIERLTKTLSTYSPRAMEEMKRVFWENTEHFERLMKERAGMSGQLVLSEQTRESLRKFKGK